MHQAVRKTLVQSLPCRTVPDLRAASRAEQPAQAGAQVQEAVAVEVAVAAAAVVEAAVEVEVAVVVGVAGAAQAADVSWFIHFIGESS